MNSWSRWKLLWSKNHTLQEGCGKDFYEVWYPTTEGGGGGGGGDSGGDSGGGGGGGGSGGGGGEDS